MRLGTLAAELRTLGLKVRCDEPMSRHTSIRIGGPADLYVEVHTLEQLVSAAERSAALEVPFFVLGGGSNLLMSDLGFRGIVIRNKARQALFGDEGKVAADSGVLLASLARQAAQRGLCGLEWAVAIPGTLGGAVVNNAGAHGGCIADVLTAVWVLGPTGQVMRRPASELRLGYRSSALKNGRPGWRQQSVAVVVRTEVQLRPGQSETIQQLMAEYKHSRIASQPRQPSAGSIFKNPAGEAAGRLIEQAGLKGLRVGNAEISPKHANFFINRGGARASDVLILVEAARAGVRRRSGIELELEVELVGEAMT